MSSELQLDVRHLNLWRRHLVNTYEVDAGLMESNGSLPSKDQLRAQRSVMSMGELFTDDPLSSAVNTSDSACALTLSVFIIIIIDIVVLCTSLGLTFINTFHQCLLREATMLVSDTVPSSSADDWLSWITLTTKYYGW